MKSIKIHNNLKLHEGYLTTSSNDYVFLKQGHIDGACGVYSLFMALILLGIEANDTVTDLKSIKRSTRFGKLLKLLGTNYNQFLQDGLDSNEIIHLVENSFSKLINSKLYNGKYLQQIIKTELQKDNAVLVGICGDDLGHWILAVGYEIDDEKNISKIFFLDPSDDEPTGYWNATVDFSKTKRRKYPHTWVDYKKGETKNVKIDEVISLQLI